jgi:hypothetical protein
MKVIAILIFISASIAMLTMDARSTTNNCNNMEKQLIARIWHGWTSMQNAKALEDALRLEAIPSIEANKPAGLRGITLLTGETDNEVEFTTIMYFESIDDVKKFAGDDYEKAHIDPAVAPLLLKYDLRVQHHQVKEIKNW